MRPWSQADIQRRHRRLRGRRPDRRRDRSVLGQTLPPLEVIVSDDGSTDELRQTVASFGDRVRYLRNEHRGAAAAMNAGVAAAEGDYAVFIGADDTFEPKRLEALAELANISPDVDVLTTDAYVAIAGKVFRRFYDETFPFAFSHQRSEILRRNFVFGHTAVLRRRFVEVGGFDESIGWTSDWELWARMILGGSRMGLVPEPLATYNIREQALSSKRLDQARGRLQTLRCIQRIPVSRPRSSWWSAERSNLLERNCLEGDPGGHCWRARLALGPRRLQSHG